MRIKSIDLTVLLVDFLSDVLTASHENRAVYNAVEIQSMDLNHVEAILKGRVIERFDEDIKAVTYHEADVTRDRNGNWRSMIIFDI